jgi:hypothetical protein
MSDTDGKAKWGSIQAHAAWGTQQEIAYLRGMAARIQDSDAPWAEALRQAERVPAVPVLRGYIQGLTRRAVAEGIALPRCHEVAQELLMAAWQAEDETAPAAWQLRQDGPYALPVQRGRMPV